MKNTLLTLKITLVQILLLLSFSAFSQCNIDLLFVEVTACEGDLFDVSIDFEHENTTNQFIVTGNGNNYGTFDYIDLPISLTSLVADCSTDYEFVVTDAIDTECSDFVEWGTVCCGEQCVLSDLILTTSDCENGDFFLTIDFDYQWNTSSTFDWEIVGVSTGTALFTDLPLTVQVFDSQDEGLGFVVTETGNPQCALESFFENPCIDPLCVIGGLSVEVGDCIDGEFSVEITFAHENTSDQFTVAGNGVNYGTYSYADLPITIDGLNGNCTTEFEFVVTDMNDNDCSNFYELGTVCCGDDCFISELDIEASECDGNQFFVVVNFEYDNTSDEFFVNANGENYGPYLYTNLPLTIQGLEGNCDASYEFLVYDSEFNGTCESDANIGIVCCESDDCILSDMILETTDCIDGLTVLTIDFDHQGATNDFFDWTIDQTGLSGTSLLQDLPLTVDVQNSTLEYLVVFVNVTDNEACELGGEVLNPCFDFQECFIGELDVEVSECDGNFFFVVIDFEYDNVSDEFTVIGNGTNYGTFFYTDLPITIDGIESDCDIQYTFLVSDVNDNNCASDVGIGAVCCEEDCNILSIDFGANPECIDGFIVTEWFIFGENTSEVGYDIYINDEFYTFVDYNGNGPYDFDIPDPETYWIGITVCDSENPDCCYIWEIPNPCFYECNLLDLVIETTECDGGEFAVTFDFEYGGTINSFFDWEIPGIGSGIVLFSDLPYTIGIDNTNMNGFDLFIHENGIPDCALEGSFENPCFDGDCQMTTLDFGPNPACEDGLIVTEWLIDGVNISEVGFDIYINNTFELFVEYNDSDWYDFDITDPGTENFTIKICDTDNANCCIDWELTNPCYDGEECQLLDLIIETSECDGSEFLLTFDFDYTGNSSDLFNWEIIGYSSGVAEYGELPLSFGVDNTSMNVFDLYINDNENPSCAIEGLFENPCFDGNECFIGELNVEVSECDGNFFFVVIDFEYENTSDEFTVNGNGVSYGSFLYADLPITIDGIESDCDVQYTFLVVDMNDNDCASDVSIGAVCCEGDCQMTTLDFGPNPACENGLIVTEWLIDGVNISEVGFDIYINNIFEVFVEYNDSDWYDFDIADPGTEFFTIKICDNDNEDCCIDWELMNPCYDGEECQLLDLIIETSECDGSEFLLTFDFDYTGNSSDLFNWEIIGYSSGVAEYGELPLSFGIDNTNMNVFDLYINDNENPSCAIEGLFENPCFDGNECFIGELNVEVSECDGNFFFVVIDFEYENTSDQFTVNGNGTSYGTFLYADLPITIDGIESNCDIQYEFVVHDVNNNDCVSDVGIGAVCCEGDCQMTTLDFGPNPACENGLIVTEWLIDGVNISEVGFDIYINNIFEVFVEYNDSDWYDFDIADPGTEFFTIKICDNDNEDCCIDWELMNPCYDGQEECFIGDLNIDVSECQGNQFFVVIDFEHENTSDDFFVNGSGGTYGPYQYANLPITIQGLEANCDVSFEFQVYDSVNNGTCTSEINIGEVCCDGEECEILSIDFGPNPICVEGLIVTEWLILGENTSEVGYDIYINNDFYIFVEYNDTDWYDFDIEDPGTEYFTIKACDNDNADCCYTWEVMNPCFEEAECDLFELDFDVSECDGNIFLLEVDFEYSGTTNEFFEWEIPGVGSGLEMFVNLPITIEIENTTDAQFTFFANENDNSDCDIVGSFGNPCYNSEGCWIEDVVAEVILCENDLFDVEIDFNYGNVGSTFSVAGNGVEYGTFEYSDLPIILTGLSADCQLEYEFVVLDAENSDCSNFVELGIICCGDFNQINDIDTETIINGDLFNITFKIGNTTLIGCNIDIYVGGELYATLGNNESTFMIGPFECGQDDVVEIEVINSCSDDAMTFVVDLSDVECLTNVEETLKGIDLKWNMPQRTLSLEGENPTSVNMQLLNAQGALVFAENNINIGWNKTFDNIPSGLYFIRIAENKGNAKTGLIQKILIY